MPTPPHIGGTVPAWLVHAPLRREVHNPRRGFFVHATANAELRGPHGGYPGNKGAAFLNRFVSNGRVTVSLSGDKSRWTEDPDMERLQGVDEVWVVRFHEPSRNHWRLMGRFVRQNVFVGLVSHRHNELNGNAYSQRANEFIAEWNRLLPGVSFLRESTVGAYLTKPGTDIDDAQIFRE